MQVYNILKDDNLEAFEKKIQKIEIVDAILSKSLKNLPEIMQSYPSLLAIAAFHGAQKCFKCLVNSGADLTILDQNNHNLLHFAACGGNLNILRVIDSTGLIEKLNMMSASDADGRTCAHYCSLFDQDSFLQYLWCHGLNIDSADNFSMKPIHYAARHNSLKVLKFLLENGQNPDAYIPSTKKRPLIFAIEGGFTQAVALLLDHKANIKISMGKKVDQTPLMYAASHNLVDILELLLQKAPRDVDVQNNGGWTALHFAAAAGNLEACQALIERNANLEMQTPFGQAPIHLASAKGYDSVVGFLEENGGSTEPSLYSFV